MNVEGLDPRLIVYNIGSDNKTEHVEVQHLQKNICNKARCGLISGGLLVTIMVVISAFMVFQRTSMVSQLFIGKVLQFTWI